MVYECLEQNHFSWLWEWTSGGELSVLRPFLIHKYFVMYVIAYYRIISTVINSHFWVLKNDWLDVVLLKLCLWILSYIQIKV